jgi:hypothetical protein
MSDSEQDDDDFEAYLKRRVPIDQRMKTVDRLEPPPELDRVIIGKARNAIQNPPHVPMYRAPKWALPVGLAATLLIAFSIVLDLGIRSARHQQLASAPVAMAANEPREMVAAPTPAPTAPSVGVRQEVASSESAAPAAAGSSSVASAKTFARMRPPPIKTAPWPPLRRATAKPAAPSDAASAEDATTESAAFDPRSRSAERHVAEKRLRPDDSERVAAAAADVSSAPAPSAAPDVASVTRVASSGADVANTSAARVTPSPAAAATAPAARVAAAAVPAPAAPPPRPLVDATANAGAPTPLRLAATSPKVSAATFDGVKVNEPRLADRFDSVSGGPAPRVAAPAVPAPAVPAPAATSAVPPSAAAASSAASAAGSTAGAPSAATSAPPSAAAAGSAADRHDHPDPKAWLDQIQKMRVAGLTAQAEQELKHFRDAYPAYPTGSPDSGPQ